MVSPSPSSEELAERRCKACAPGAPKLGPGDVARYAAAVPGWSAEGDRLRRTLRFANFVALMAFVNQLADLAEREGHHPDFSVHYSRLELELWTHAIGGLSENDFILAAKIDALGG